MRRFRAWRARLTSEDELTKTIDLLLAQGEIDAGTATRWMPELPSVLQECGYILSHLGAHLAIGVIFAFDFVPLPLGSISRVLWVIGSRAYETIRGRWELARVHSWRVLLLSAIPIAGYFSYLIPLRRRHPEFLALFANHLTYLWQGTTLHQFLKTKPRWIRSLVNGMIGTLPGDTAPSSQRTKEASAGDSAKSGHWTPGERES